MDDTKCKITAVFPRYIRHRVTRLEVAIGALCIIAGCSDERMRLLAEGGRKSQFYYSTLFFRKCPLRFHAARFSKVAARWKPKKKGRRARRERMWLTPRSNRAFAGFLHPENAATKENRRNRSTAASCPSDPLFLLQ